MEEIYKLYRKDNPKFVPLIGYESSLITIINEKIGLEEDEQVTIENWKDKVRSLGITICRYRYYIETGHELIRIIAPDGTERTRPIMVEGMKRHTCDQLVELRCGRSFRIQELGEIEGW